MVMLLHLGNQKNGSRPLPHTHSAFRSLSFCLSLRGEPDAFVFCSLFALKSHHDSMQSNELAQPERKAGNKTGNQTDRYTHGQENCRK